MTFLLTESQSDAGHVDRQGELMCVLRRAFLTDSTVNSNIWNGSMTVILDSSEEARVFGHGVGNVLYAIGAEWWKEEECGSDWPLFQRSIYNLFSPWNKQRGHHKIQDNKIKVVQ